MLVGGVDDGLGSEAQSNDGEYARYQWPLSRTKEVRSYSQYYYSDYM
jgi:hypothetical protein